jgi:DNA-binding IclR family transcriptional regulator
MDSVNALGRLGLYPASKGGVGMALLAQQTDEHIAALYDQKDIDGYEAGLGQLMVSINAIRQQGYSYIETQKDTHTLAVAVGKPEFCAIALSGWIPESSIPELVKSLNDVALIINELPH